MSAREPNWRGGIGLLFGVLLWVASIAALLAALRANEVAGLLARQHGRLSSLAQVQHLQYLAVMWSVVLAALQIAAMLLGTAVLRVWYGLRAAVCFAVSGGTVVLLNAVWLFGLLVWLRMYGDTL